MFITAAVSLVIYVGLLAFLMFMTKVFLCKNENYK
jgi:hypothetical protein